MPASATWSSSRAPYDWAHMCTATLPEQHGAPRRKAATKTEPPGIRLPPRLSHKVCRLYLGSRACNCTRW